MALFCVYGLDSILRLFTNVHVHVREAPFRQRRSRNSSHCFVGTNRWRSVAIPAIHMYMYMYSYKIYVHVAGMMHTQVKIVTVHRDDIAVNCHGAP